MKNLLISIEGIDGCGKSTLATMLANELKKLGQDIVLTKEPGQTPIGEKIKTILYSEKENMSSITEFLLFAANRAQHFKELIIPALKQGRTIISDRMNISSIAYQGYGLGLDVEMLEKINGWAMQNIEPDFIIYIKLTPEVALERIKKRNQSLTPFETEEKEYWNKIINGYDTALKDLNNVITLDGNLSPSELLEQAKSIILNKQQS